MSGVVLHSQLYGQLECPISLCSNFFEAPPVFPYILPPFVRHTSTLLLKRGVILYINTGLE